MVQSIVEQRNLKRLPACFYRLDSGWPVREWLKTPERRDRKVIGEDVKDVEFSWPTGMPLVRSMGGGLWEVRSSLRDGTIARILSCVELGRMMYEEEKHRVFVR